MTQEMAIFVHFHTISCSSWKQHWIPRYIYSLSLFQFPSLTIDQCVPCMDHLLCTSSNWLGLGSFLNPFSLDLMITILEICTYIQVYSSTLKMEAACSSETSPTAHKTAQLHHLNNHDPDQCSWHCSGLLCCWRTKKKCFATDVLHKTIQFPVWSLKVYAAYQHLCSLLTFSFFKNDHPMPCRVRLGTCHPSHNVGQVNTASWFTVSNINTTTPSGG